MADETDDSLIFEADIDASQYNSKIDLMVAKLQAAQRAQQLAKDEAKDFEKAVNANAKAIDKLDKEIEQLDKHSKTYRADLKALNAEADALRKTHIQMTGGFEQARAAVASTTNSVRTYNASVKALSRDSNFLNTAMSDFTSRARIGGQIVNNLRGHVISLASGIVGGLVGGLTSLAIPALVEFVAQLIKGSDATNKLALDTANATAIQNKAAEGQSQGIAQLEILRNEINDTNNSNAERIKLVREYNKIADEGNKISETEFNNTEKVNAAINRQIGLIKQRALAKAAENVLAEKAEKLFKAQLAVNGRTPTFDPEKQASSSADAIEQRKIFEEADAIILKRNQQLGSNEKFNVTEILGFALGVDDESIKRLAEKNQKFKILLDKDTKDKLKQLAERQSRLAFQDQRSPEVAEKLFFGTTLDELFEDLNAATLDFNSALDQASKLIKPEALFTKDKATKAGKTIENVYEQMLRELMAKLRAATKDEFQSEELIVTEISNKLVDELEKISKLVAEGKLTQQQGLNLQSILNAIFGAEQDKAIKDFRKKVEEAIKIINDAIITAQQEATTQRIANITNDLQREAAAINNQFDVAIDALLKKRDELIKKVNEDQKKGLLSKGQGDEKRGIIGRIYDTLIGEQVALRDNRKEALLFSQFEAGISDITAKFDEFELENAERTARRIEREQLSYMTGEINYKKFQKNVTKILADAAQERSAIRRQELGEQIKATVNQIDVTSDPDTKKKLQARARQLRKELAELDTKGTGDDPNKDRDAQFKAIADYTKAIGDLASQVVAFWQAANEAEQKALERSIQLQETRVDAARRIAERGNAEYLQLEEDRLKELQLKRENAARRELAINAILQTSQALVAFTSALAQGIATGGPLGGIAIAASVIGLLASGYAIVKSLQPDTQSFYEGTTDVRRKGNTPAGRDTVPAMLNEGEAVIPTDTNRQYKPTVEAIYNKKVPAEAINRFVNMYGRGEKKSELNYEGLAAATQMAVGADGRMYAIMSDNNRKLEEQNATLRAMNKQLRKLGVSVSLDRNGFALSMVDAARQIDINKKL